MALREGCRVHREVCKEIDAGTGVVHDTVRYLVWVLKVSLPLGTVQDGRHESEPEEQHDIDLVGESKLIEDDPYLPERNAQKFRLILLAWEVVSLAISALNS